MTDQNPRSEGKGAVEVHNGAASNKADGVKDGDEDKALVNVSTTGDWHCICI